MKDNVKTTVIVEQVAELYDRISADTLLPGERAVDKEQLRMQFLDELAPATAYERSLAEQLVDIEWEVLRHRRLREAAYLAAYRGRATSYLTKRNPERPLQKLPLTKDEIRLARDLVSADPKVRADAEEDFFAETECDPRHVLALAVGQATAAEKHIERIADLERRRRALRKDYADLKAAAARDIEDAEIVE